MIYLVTQLRIFRTKSRFTIASSYHLIGFKSFKMIPENKASRHVSDALKLKPMNIVKNMALVGEQRYGGDSS